MWCGIYYGSVRDASAEKSACCVRRQISFYAYPFWMFWKPIAGSNRLVGQENNNKN
jgi:hypothetical protein